MAYIHKKSLDSSTHSQDSRNYMKYNNERRMLLTSLGSSSVIVGRQTAMFPNFIKILQLQTWSSFPILFHTASCTSQLAQINKPVETNFHESESYTVPGSQIKRSKEIMKKYETVNEIEVNKWLEKETGIERVRNMFILGSDGNFIQEETRVMNKMWFRTVLSGFCINVFTSTLASEKKRKNVSMTNAIQKDNSQSFPKGLFSRQALRNTLKLSVWAGSIIYISQVMATYRNKTSIWEYIISSAIGFGSLAITDSAFKIAQYTSFGAIFGLFGGILICKMMTNSCNTQEMRHTRHIKNKLQNQIEEDII